MGCYKRCYLKEWAHDTADIHGLKHIAGDGGNIRRLIWTLATLSAFGYFLYLAILSLISFAESNHVTKTDVESKSEISFPAFTVCNFNKYREAAITEHDIKNVGTHLGESFNVCFLFTFGCNWFYFSSSKALLLHLNNPLFRRLVMPLRYSELSVKQRNDVPGKWKWKYPFTI